MADGTITNSTIYGNRMPGPGNNKGGGIAATGNVTITNSTIASNSISSSYGWLRWGGGVYGGTVTFKNTVLSSNWPNNCEGATVASGGNNIDSGDTCGFADATDLVNTDPLLDVLADNGGPTPTMALLPGSPAIDAGDDAVCAAAPVNGVDQRGNPRPQGTHCDIGAVEAP